MYGGGSLMPRCVLTFWLPSVKALWWQVFCFQSLSDSGLFGRGNNAIFAAHSVRIADLWPPKRTADPLQLQSDKPGLPGKFSCQELSNVLKACGLSNVQLLIPLHTFLYGMSLLILPLHRRNNRKGLEQPLGRCLLWPIYCKGSWSIQPNYR